MSGTPQGPAYHRVERLHLRQWALRLVPPLAALATNGGGWLDASALPRWDSPLRALGAGPGADAAWTSAWTAAGLVAGSALVAAAAVLRVASKSVLVRKTTVTTAGAYGLVRHPYYLANLVGAAGTFVLAGPLGAAAGVAWLAAAVPVFVVTIRGEEAALRAIHGAAWDAYAASVPPLLPRPGRRSGGAGAPTGSAPAAPRGAWANLVAEGEPPRCLRFLAGALAVAALRLGGTAGTVALAASAALFAGSHLVPRRARPDSEAAATQGR